MAEREQREGQGHPSHVMAVATRAYKLATRLGRQREAGSTIRKAFIKTYGDLRGECFYSIWLEWADDA
ncbi:MAG: hypothetical protein HW409_940 [candidate division NC10 bacterium]|jgi:hypothetical protein|nr:hypothetical protein [candidate division NC10 bacterium]MBM2836751.1 hypothetical protein [candidate division NC10 bacterium]